MRKSPEQWLQEVTPRERKSVFKLFLGYAPGVGKTYNMLSEGIRRSQRGEDVVIGYVETHGRKGIEELSQKLPAVARCRLDYRGVSFEEMDVDAVLSRRPAVALVDELAHTNVEGSRNRKRYEDVVQLLDAGVDVISTINVQHIESLTPMVQRITGVEVRETVPDWVVDRATEIVLADLTPEALHNRMLRGDIYPLERAERALQHFFRPGNLSALRELALQQVTRAVDQSLHTKQDDKAEAIGLRERIAVCISSNPAAKYLIARAARMAERADAELYVLYVDFGQDASSDRQRTLKQNIQFAQDLKAEVVSRRGRNVAEVAAAFVRERQITQIIFGRSAQTGWRRYLYFSAVQRFLRHAPAVDVHIVTQEFK